MKYIRTKDNHIYKLSGGDTDIENVKESYVWCYDERLRTHFRVEKDLIIKQANTIKELCDEFVSVYKNLTPELLEPKFISPREPLSISWKNRLEEERLFKDNAVYGAIWTDKGLIYVTKMNDKGEFELL